MSLLYKWCAIPGIVVSGLLLYFMGLFALALSFTQYPGSVLILVPWYLGACGVLGLLAALRAPKPPAPWQLSVRIALLLCGIAGASIFVTLFLQAFDRSATDGRGILAATLLVFPGLPICAAVIALISLVGTWRGTGGVARGMLLRTVALVAGPLMLLLAARVLVQEAGMLWYGHELTSRAQQSAARIADGRTYCVMDQFGTDSLSELPVRKILVQAFAKRFGAIERPFITPHFMIAVDSENYWWSFRQQGFVPVPPHYTGALPSNRCAP